MIQMGNASLSMTSQFWWEFTIGIIFKSLLPIDYCRVSKVSTQPKGALSPGLTFEVRLLLSCYYFGIDQGQLLHACFWDCTIFEINLYNDKLLSLYILLKGCLLLRGRLISRFSSKHWKRLLLSREHLKVSSYFWDSMAFQGITVP